MDVSQLHFCLRLFLHRGKPQELFLGSLNIFLSIVEELQSQKKIVGTLPPPSVPPLMSRNVLWERCVTSKKRLRGRLNSTPRFFFLIVARLLILPMWFIVVNSPNLAHQHWEGKKTVFKCPNNFEGDYSWVKNQQFWYLINQLYKSIIFNTTM